MAGVTVAEFKQVLNTLGILSSENQARVLFCRYDCDGDGILRQHEWLRGPMPASYTSARMKDTIKEECQRFEDSARIQEVRAAQKLPSCEAAQAIHFSSSRKNGRNRGSKKGSGGKQAKRSSGDNEGYSMSLAAATQVALAADVPATSSRGSTPRRPSAAALPVSPIRLPRGSSGRGSQLELPAVKSPRPFSQASGTNSAMMQAWGSPRLISPRLFHGPLGD